MPNIFKLKEFDILQDDNAQKVGTDSMLLGAWVSKELNKASIHRVLDIGTGTGLLALMMAQTFRNADITAIEPDLKSHEEALINFQSSPFSNRLMGIQTALQNFGSIEKFDLIICNPPYFDGTYKSDDEDRNRARHNTGLTANELYECAEELLSENGTLAVVIPHTDVTEHLERAFDQELFLSKILFSIKENGQRKRAFLLIDRKDDTPTESELLVKTSDNHYSADYIELTKQFYHTNLSDRQANG